MDTPVHADLDKRVGVDTEGMDWAASPSPGVLRKRLHRVGDGESGQVTSIVRYEPGSRFPAHEHPEGEEILVLEGTFSDEHGDWPAGTYLLNPEGFRHAPFSDGGCVLFVKLRQLPGADRRHVAIQAAELEWEPTPLAGVDAKELYAQKGYSDRTRLERWAPGTKLPAQHYEHGAEMLVLAGAFADEYGAYGKGTWLRLPAGGHHRPRTGVGCELYVKRGGLPYLRAPEPA